MGGICLAVLFGHTQSTVSLPVMERCAEEVMATVGAKCPSRHLGLEPKHTFRYWSDSRMVRWTSSWAEICTKRYGHEFPECYGRDQSMDVPRKQVGLGIRDWMD